MNPPPGARRLRWYFDFISPFSYLQWQKIKPLASAQMAITPVPVLFGAVLQAHGQKGPAEIPGKREFTYRHVLWQARAEGVPLVFPPSHPFNPLHALRLAIAAGGTVEAVDAVFEWIWTRGQAGDSPEALAPLMAALGVDPAQLGSDATRAALRANTEAAIARGVYGVPTLEIDDELFWGNDAHGFAIAALKDPGVLADDEMRRVSALPVGIRRGA